MAVTIWRRVINNNRTHIRIINKKPEQRAVKVRGDIRATRHEISEVKNYE